MNDTTVTLRVMSLPLALGYRLPANIAVETGKEAERARMGKMAAPGVGFSPASPVAAKEQKMRVPSTGMLGDKVAEVGSLSPGFSLRAKDVCVCPQVCWSMPYPFLPQHAYPTQ